MMQRKPILLVDGSEKSQQAMMLLKSNGIEYVEYDVRKFAESCCGDLPTTKTPSVFAPEGIFKDLDEIRKYVTMDRKNTATESESAYW